MKRWSVGDEVKVFGCESNGTPKLYGRGQIIEILPPLTRHACERYKVRITHLRRTTVAGYQCASASAS
jgi:hypothetical protein